MPISITCTKCEKVLRAPDSASGKKIRCPACDTVVDVPAPDDEDLVAPDDDAPADPNTAVSNAPQTPKKKPAWDDDDEEPDDRDDDKDDIKRRRPKKRKKSKRAVSEYEKLLDKRKGPKEPHRGIGILIIGILAIVFAFVPPIAWALTYSAEQMSATDFIEMDTGRMDPAGLSLTKAGRICGWVGAVLSFLPCIICCGFAIPFLAKA